MTEEVIGQLAQVPWPQGDFADLERGAQGCSPHSATDRGYARACGMSSRAPCAMSGSRHPGGGQADRREDATATSGRRATIVTSAMSSGAGGNCPARGGLAGECGRDTAEHRTRGAIRTHPAAYDAYLGGRYLMYRRTRDALRDAMKQFERAIARDSTLCTRRTRGWRTCICSVAVYDYQLASICYDRERPGYSDGRPSDRARLNVGARATRLEATPWPAIGAPGPSGSRADFQRALELRPSSANVHQWYATIPGAGSTVRGSARAGGAGRRPGPARSRGPRGCFELRVGHTALRCGGPGGVDGRWRSSRA